MRGVIALLAVFLALCGAAPASGPPGAGEAEVAAKEAVLSASPAEERRDPAPRRPAARRATPAARPAPAVPEPVPPSVRRHVRLCVWRE